MAKSRFRIIALRPITPECKDEETISRVKSIQKKVFGGGWLYFFDGYKLKDIPDALAGDEDMQPFYGFQLDVPNNPDCCMIQKISLSASVLLLVRMVVERVRLWS